MNMLDSTLSLKEIEHTIAEAIASCKGKARTIGDLGLTSEDYKILALRFRCFRKYQNDINIYEQFSLSLLAYGSYIFQVEPDVKEVERKFYGIASQIPQYLQRKILDEFDSTIKENALSNPSIHLKTPSQLISLLLLYSCNNDAIYQQYFRELDSIEEGIPVEERIDEITEKVFWREKMIFDKDAWNHGFGMLKAAYLDCRRNHYSESEMLTKYTRLSYIFLSSCSKWFETHQEKTNLKIVK